MKQKTEAYSKLREKCAVVGIVGENAPLLAAESLFALQHRGAEASGIVSTQKDGSLAFRKKS